MAWGQRGGSQKALWWNAFSLHKEKENTGCTKKNKVVLNPHMGLRDMRGFKKVLGCMYIVLMVTIL